MDQLWNISLPLPVCYKNNNVCIHETWYSPCSLPLLSGLPWIWIISDYQLIIFGLSMSEPGTCTKSINICRIRSIFSTKYYLTKLYSLFSIYIYISFFMENHVVYERIMSRVISCILHKNVLPFFSYKNTMWIQETLWFIEIITRHSLAWE